jgi:hypothetical protein
MKYNCYKQKQLEQNNSNEKQTEQKRTQIKTIDHGSYKRSISCLLGFHGIVHVQFVTKPQCWGEMREMKEKGEGGGGGACTSTAASTSFDPVPTRSYPRRPPTCTQRVSHHRSKKHFSTSLTHRRQGSAGSPRAHCVANENARRRIELQDERCMPVDTAGKPKRNAILKQSGFE